MFGQFLLTFREALEAMLITMIVVGYLKRTGRGSLTRYVWLGVYLAVALSLVSGVSIYFIYGTLSESAKTLFEGVASFLAVFVLSYMIYWMAIKGKHIKAEVERRVEAIVTSGAILGIVSLSFVIVFREGLETVLFLTPFILKDVAGTLFGAFLGVAASLALAFLIYIVGMKISIRKFFYYTSTLLIFLAGGLAGYGIHELVEYFEYVGIDPGWLGEYAYVLPISEDSVLHHKGIIGSIFAVMFGYSVKAEWIRVIVHLLYLATALPFIIWIYRKR